MRLRLAFWMKDPAGGPGDVVGVPDSRAVALVRAGIGHPEDDAAPPAADPAATPDQPPPVPPASPKTATKAAKTD